MVLQGQLTVVLSAQSGSQGHVPPTGALSQVPLAVLHGQISSAITNGRLSIIINAIKDKKTFFNMEYFSF
ncbi:MAG: hypothetical protein WC475_04825 [Candidatus Paceibacterota bacterium]